MANSGKHHDHAGMLWVRDTRITAEESFNEAKPKGFTSSKSKRLQARCYKQEVTRGNSERLQKQKLVVLIKLVGRIPSGQHVKE